MLARLYVLVKVLVLAGVAVALLPENQEDRVVPISLQEECASKCSDLNPTYRIRRDALSRRMGCGVKCKIEQCTKGCEAWKQALDTSCKTVCVSIAATFYFYDIYPTNLRKSAV